MYISPYPYCVLSNLRNVSPSSNLSQVIGVDSEVASLPAVLSPRGVAEAFLPVDGIEIQQYLSHGLGASTTAPAQKVAQRMSLAWVNYPPYSCE